MIIIEYTAKYRIINDSIGEKYYFYRYLLKKRSTVRWIGYKVFFNLTSQICGCMASEPHNSIIGVFEKIAF